MKYLTYLVVATVGLSYAYAQTTNTVWNATVTVLNEVGQPMAGAYVEIGYYIKPPSGQSEAGENIHGLTDSNGIFTASHENTGSIDLGFRASKAGYHNTVKEHEFATFRDSDPQKWNPTTTLQLKKVGKPIAMYAKQITSLKVPEFNKAIAYDLMIGDWVGSYGKGINTDLFITEKHTTPQSGYILSVSFPNHGDGIQEFTLSEWEKGSDLRSPHEAPVDGYQPELAQTETTNPKRNFYFRVRTKLDESGNVVSARYGKIYGDLAQFTYYFNPTLNDRNVEFDPKQNLLGGLQSFEQVTAP